MYLRILKKDLKRKRAMNLILLLFIALAAMFVSSSVNNILTVTTALDSYFDMAQVSDVTIVNSYKASSESVDEAITNASGTKNVKTEEFIILANNNIFFEGEQLNATTNTQFLQSDSDMSIKYFLEDNTPLEKVPEGEVYLTMHALTGGDISAGDKITITINGKSREFTVAGGVMDAVFGSNMMNILRFIVSEKDFDYFHADDKITNQRGGKIYYINSSDPEATKADASVHGDGFLFEMDRASLEFTYVFDMIITGLILVISLILIGIAFLVLRFTISFTLSEEVREIGVMKAIGIENYKIRGLYLVKYAGISLLGSAAGFFLSIPFGKLLISVSSQSMIINNKNPILINLICSLAVIFIIMLFCYGCTGRVKKMSPIDAIRSGQTGERFRKKSIMSLGRSRLATAPFLALNDIISSPARFFVVILTFFLCLCLLLMLSATALTLRSRNLLTCFGVADCDVTIASSNDNLDFMVKDGDKKSAEYLSELEKTLAENDMPANCYFEMLFNPNIYHGDKYDKFAAYYGIGTTMDMYEYIEGTPPQNPNEIAMTRLAAEELDAAVGDTVTVKIGSSEKEYIITALYQSMNNLGKTMRFYSGEDIDFSYAGGSLGVQIDFTDSPDEAEIERRIKRMQKLYPEFENIYTAGEWVEKNVGVADALQAIKSMVAVLAVLLPALITVLMERSFIAKERGEIALMKAVGIKNSCIYSCHTLRFLFVGIAAAALSEILVMPLTHLCIDPIFKMMGMELAVEYVIDPMEMYLIFPLLIILTTALSAFLTSLYTMKIRPSDTAGIE